MYELFLVGILTAACACFYLERMIVVGVLLWFLVAFALIGAGMAGDIPETRANVIGGFLFLGPVVAIALGSRRRRIGR